MVVFFMKVTWICMLMSILPPTSPPSLLCFVFIYQRNCMKVHASSSEYYKILVYDGQTLHHHELGQYKHHCLGLGFGTELLGVSMNI